MLHVFQIRRCFEGPGQVDILDRKLTESKVRNLQGFHIQHDWLFPEPPPSWQRYFSDLMREISQWPTVFVPSLHGDPYSMFFLGWSRIYFYYSLITILSCLVGFNSKEKCGKYSVGIWNFATKISKQKVSGEKNVRSQLMAVWKVAGKVKNLNIKMYCQIIIIFLYKRVDDVDNFRHRSCPASSLSRYTRCFDVLCKCKEIPFIFSGKNKIR